MSMGAKLQFIRLQYFLFVKLLVEVAERDREKLSDIQEVLSFPWKKYYTQ